MIYLEKQLWEWLADCEARKPGSKADSEGCPDKAVRVLQCEAREGREASEAGDRTQSGEGKLQ